jgi:hypothetical protein
MGVHTVDIAKTFKNAPAKKSETLHYLISACNATYELIFVIDAITWR